MRVAATQHLPCAAVSGTHPGVGVGAAVGGIDEATSRVEDDFDVDQLLGAGGVEAFTLLRAWREAWARGAGHEKEGR